MKVSQANTQFFENNLTEGAQVKLRLCKIFKSLASITYDDIFSHPWKVPFFVVPTPFLLGTMVTLGTMVYYLKSKSDRAVEARKDLSRAKTSIPQVRVYKNFMSVSPDNPEKLDMSIYQMMRYMWQWNSKYLKSKFYMRSLLKGGRRNRRGFVRMLHAS